MRKNLRQLLIAISAGALLAIPATVGMTVFAEHAMAAQQRPAFSCVSGNATVQDLGNFGNLYYAGTPQRWQVRNSGTIVCTNKQVLSSGEIEIVGTGNCLTYHTGNYLYSLSCQNKASQQWTYSSDHTLFNNYGGNSSCLQAPGTLQSDVFMAGCNNSDNYQLWTFNT